MDRGIRLLLVDDHAVVRAGLRTLLETRLGLTVAGEAGDGEEALGLVTTLKPNVVLMDLAMRGMSGLEATAIITRENPGVRVLVLTMHEDETYFFHALRAGASGYMLKESSPEELVTAVRAVHQGGVYFQPAMARTLLNQYLHRASEGEEEGLTALSEREQQVLRLIADGRTAREIGCQLYISPRTVERHRAQIMQKLGLHTGAHPLRPARGRGLFAPPSPPRWGVLAPPGAPPPPGGGVFARERRVGVRASSTLLPEVARGGPGLHWNQGV